MVLCAMEREIKNLTGASFLLKNLCLLGLGVSLPLPGRHLGERMREGLRKSAEEGNQIRKTRLTITQCTPHTQMS